MNPRPSGYEPDELPDCSTPRRAFEGSSRVDATLRAARVCPPQNGKDGTAPVGSESREEPA